MREHGSYLQGMETWNTDGSHLFLLMHGSYLQGMETKHRKVTKTYSRTCTDPTYKEWKLHPHLCPSVLGELHGSYLQGMETVLLLSWLCTNARARILPTRNGNYICRAALSAVAAPWHGSYLQGMETDVVSMGFRARNSTDPTYKEWKLGFNKPGWASYTARILPTRNGNVDGL